MSGIEHRHLRSALEYAVLIAAEGQKRRPPLPYPKDLKPLLHVQRLPASKLGRVRRAVEAAPEFRAAIAAGAVPELVDEIGRLWLDGREGWEDRAAELLAEAENEAASKDLAKQLKRAEKRREAAEQAAARSQAELLARDDTIAEQLTEIDDLRADLTKALEQMTELRAELIDTRNDVRHARDRERAVRARLDASGIAAPAEPAETDRRSARVQIADLEDRLARVTEELQRERGRRDGVVEASREFLDRLDELTTVTESGADVRSAPTAAEPRRARRQPLPLPGGTISTSAEAADHLIRAGALVLVDGYNVSKLGWPDRPLEQQRNALVDRCENLARRCGTDIAIVFDGASVAGAHASSRRSIRVVYSPDGVTADDVIRAEVENLPPERAVVVVTNDRAIVDDVRAAGANIVPSNAFIAVF